MSAGAGPRRGFFDAWSSFYDFPLVQRATYRPVHDAVLAVLRAHAPRTILDLGCGTGHLLERLAASGPATRLVGCDYSAGMLAHAAFRLATPPAPGRPTARLVCGDAGRLPLANGSVDAVVSTEAFHWFPDQPAALAEIRRVLVPGGTLVLALTCPPFSLVGDAFRLASTALGAPLAWPTATAMRTLVTHAGFEVERQHRIFRIPGFLLPPLLTAARRV